MEQLKLTPSLLDIDFSETQNRICRFIKEYVENAGAKGIVLGLIGGVDSATIAALSSLAIGGENVLALMLPEKETFNQKDIDDAKAIADPVSPANASLRHDRSSGELLQGHP